MDVVLTALMDLWDAHGGGAAAAAASADDAEEAPTRRNRNQLVRLSDFDGDDNSLSYLTGLGRQAREWLFPRLAEAVRRFC